mmetsp:Transcript_42306/g.101815  ORF Transcript_42306/g.101815 Transcript_42306/m.101815 type:complete len:219 (+) Transcript_42306:705-1361(+)
MKPKPRRLALVHEPQALHRDSVVPKLGHDRSLVRHHNRTSSVPVVRLRECTSRHEVKHVRARHSSLRHCCSCSLRGRQATRITDPEYVRILHMLRRPLVHSAKSVRISKRTLRQKLERTLRRNHMQKVELHLRLTLRTSLEHSDLLLAPDLHKIVAHDVRDPALLQKLLQWTTVVRNTETRHAASTELEVLRVTVPKPAAQIVDQERRLQWCPPALDR